MVLISSRCAMLKPLSMGSVSRHTTLSVALVGLLGVLAGCVHASATDRAQSLVRQHREEDAVALLRMDLVRTPGRRAGATAARAPPRLHRGHGRCTRRDRGARASSRSGRSDSVRRARARARARPPVRRGARGVRRRPRTRRPQSPAGPREGGMRSARWGEARGVQAAARGGDPQRRERRRDVARARARALAPGRSGRRRAGVPLGDRGRSAGAGELAGARHGRRRARATPRGRSRLTTGCSRSVPASRPESSVAPGRWQSSDARTTLRARSIMPRSSGPRRRSSRGSGQRWPVRARQGRRTANKSRSSTGR